MAMSNPTMDAISRGGAVANQGMSVANSMMQGVQRAMDSTSDLTYKLTNLLKTEEARKFNQGMAITNSLQNQFQFDIQQKWKDDQLAETKRRNAADEAIEGAKFNLDKDKYNLNLQDRNMANKLIESFTSNKPSIDNTNPSIPSFLEQSGDITNDIYGVDIRNESPSILQQPTQQEKKKSTDDGFGGYSNDQLKVAQAASISPNKYLRNIGSSILNIAKFNDKMNASKVKSEQQAWFNQSLSELEKHSNIPDTYFAEQDSKTKYNYWNKLYEESMKLEANAPKGMKSKASAMTKLFKTKADAANPYIADAYSSAADLVNKGYDEKRIAKELDRMNIPADAKQKVLNMIPKMKADRKQKGEVYSKILKKQADANTWFESDDVLWSNLAEMAKEFPDDVGSQLVQIAESVDNGQGNPFMNWRGINEREDIARNFLIAIRSNPQLAEWFDKSMKEKYKDDIPKDSSIYELDVDDYELASKITDLLQDSSFTKDFRSFTKALKQGK